MKILYGIQLTGNGHLSRANDILPVLKKNADVDVILSGTESSIQFEHDYKYKKTGLCFYFGKNGDIDLLKSLRKFKPIQLIKDTLGLKVEEYNLVVSDFEPISSWAAKLRNVPCIGLSHQASFKYDNTPRPVTKNSFGEFTLKHYAPADHNIGLHFKSYHDNIITPLIKNDIRHLRLEEHNHYCVYLPAYSPRFLISFLSKFRDSRWRVFSKHTKKYFEYENVKVFPVSKEFWIESLRTCKGVLMGAGFEGPSEAIYMGKKLFVVPMKSQYEQLCNAIALKQLGIDFVTQLDEMSYEPINNWIKYGCSIQIEYPDNRKEIVQSILNYKPMEKEIITNPNVSLDL